MLEEALTNLINNQALFLAHPARADERFARIGERFAHIESELADIKTILVHHQRILEALPKAIRENLRCSNIEPRKPADEEES